MKKREAILILSTLAAACGAFALGGCKEKITDDGNRYVICSDGNGKSYVFKGGETLVAYYPYDVEKTLTFTVSVYSVQTDELVDEYEWFTHDCSDPRIFSGEFEVVSGGKAQPCTLTVITSAQGVADQLVENDTDGTSHYIDSKTGFTYSFIPKMTGAYTFTCTPKDEADKVEYIVTDLNGVPLKKDKALNSGWKYYVHIRVTPADGDDCLVTTYAAFTPQVLQYGDNNVTLGMSGNTFEFTPEESGAYAFTDDTGSDLYQILDYETYERITATQWENEVILDKGVRYLVDGQVGFEKERQAILTVKRVDRELSPDAENELKWNGYYVLNIDKHANYTFSVTAKNKYHNAINFAVYGLSGYESFVNSDVIDSGKINAVLDAGRYLVKANDDCTLSYSFAPKNIYDWAKAGEIISFTPVLSCNYSFESQADGGTVTITDTDGSPVEGALTAGSEYYLSCDKAGTIDATPNAQSIAVHNAEIQATEYKAVAFKPVVSGYYIFKGATELSVFSERYKDGVLGYYEQDLRVEPDGFSAYLDNSTTYYAQVKAGTLTYGDSVHTAFYPAALPADLTTRVFSNSSRGYHRIELPVAGKVTIAKFGGTDDLNMEILDGNLTPITSSVNSVSATLEQGVYYLHCYGSVQKIGFTEHPAPAAAGDPVAVEEGVYYFTSGTETYLYANSDFNENYFTVTVKDFSALYEDYEIYYLNGTHKTTLRPVEYSGKEHEITLKYKRPTGCGIFYIAVHNPLTIVINGNV